MTLADDLLPVVYEGRALAGEFGFRKHTARIMREGWSGQHTGEGASFTQGVDIQEANNQPPRIRWLNDEEIAVGNLGRGTVEIGPITPAFSGGGTDLAELTGKLTRGMTRYVVIRGPNHPNGARYRITEVQAERALRYMLRAEPSFTEYDPP